MIKVKTNTGATEDIITDKFMPVTKQLWDEAMEKGAPLYSPKEIAEVFPNLNKDSQRQALLRVAGREKSEEGEHVRAVIAFTNRIRAEGDYNDCWDIFVSDVFKGISNKLRREYFIDIYTMWCYPTRVRGGTLQEYIESEENSHNKYLAMVYKDANNITVADLDEFGKNFIKLLAEAEKKNDTGEKEKLETALDFIGIIQDVMDGELLNAWETLNNSICSIGKDWDSAPTMLELMRIFYKKG